MLTLPLDHIRFQPSAMAGMGGGRTGRVKLPERKLGASLWFELLLKKRKVSARAQGMAAHSACTYPMACHSANLAASETNRRIMFSVCRGERAF